MSLINANFDTISLAERMPYAKVCGQEKKWYVEGMMGKSRLVENLVAVIERR